MVNVSFFWFTVVVYCDHSYVRNTLQQHTKACSAALRWPWMLRSVWRWNKKNLLARCFNSTYRGGKSGETLHASHEQSTFLLWIQKSILAWLLKPCHERAFFAITSCWNKRHFRRYNHCCPAPFPGPAQCGPISFSSHISLFLCCFFMPHWIY